MAPQQMYISTNRQLFSSVTSQSTKSADPVCFILLKSTVRKVKGPGLLENGFQFDQICFCRQTLKLTQYLHSGLDSRSPLNSDF